MTHVKHRNAVTKPLIATIRVHILPLNSISCLQALQDDSQVNKNTAFMSVNEEHMKSQVKVTAWGKTPFKCHLQTGVSLAPLVNSYQQMLIFVLSWPVGPSPLLWHYNTAL